MVSHISSLCTQLLKVGYTMITFIDLPELTEIRLAEEALLGRDDPATSLTMRSIYLKRTLK